MNLISIREGLLKEIQTKPAMEKYEDARRQNALLQPFETLVELANFLNKPTREYVGTSKPEIVKFLLEEYQTREDRLWGSVLTLGFIPWLINLAQKIECDEDVCSQEEQAMLILETFLDVAGKYKLTPSRQDIVVVHLLRRVEEAVFGIINGLSRVHRNEVLMDIDQLDEFQKSDSDPESMLSNRHGTDLEFVEKAISNLRRYSNEHVDMIDLITKTTFENVKLSDYLRNSLGENAENFSKEYERAQKIRKRFLKKIQNILSD